MNTADERILEMQKHLRQEKLQNELSDLVQRSQSEETRTIELQRRLAEERRKVVGEVLRLFESCPIHRLPEEVRKLSK